MHTFQERTCRSHWIELMHSRSNWNLGMAPGLSSCGTPEPSTFPGELCFQRDCNHVCWYRVTLLLVAEGMENTFRAVHKLVHHEKLVDSPKCVFHGEQLRGFDGGSRWARDIIPHILTFDWIILAFALHFWLFVGVCQSFVSCVFSTVFRQGPNYLWFLYKAWSNMPQSACSSHISYFVAWESTCWNVDAIPGIKVAALGWI